MISHLNERISDEKLKEYFAAMVDEIGWITVTEILQRCTKFLNIFRQGSFQLKPKNINRARDIIIKHSEDRDRTGIFHFWLCNNPEYESFIESLPDVEEKEGDDECQKNAGEEHILDDSLFENLVSLVTAKHAIFFLCFSHLIFSKRQEKILLEPSNFKKTKTQDRKNKESSKPPSPDRRLIEEIKNLKKQIRENKKANLNITNENKSLKGHIKHLQTELEKQNKLATYYEERIASAENSYEETKKQLESDLNNGDLELSEARAKIANLTAALKTRAEAIKQLEDDLEKSKRFYSDNIMSIINHINMPELIASLNEPNDIKEILNSVVQIPSDDQSIKDSMSAKQFKQIWYVMVQKELKTIKKIVGFEVGKMLEDSFTQDWPDHVDMLTELKWSLKARVELSILIYEIMKSFFDAEKYEGEDQSKSGKENTKKSIYSESIDFLNLPRRSRRQLNNAKVESIGQLVCMSENDILKNKILGRSGLQEVISVLKDKNLRFGMEI